MKLGKNRIHLLIMLFAVSSLLVHVPSDAYAAVDTWTDAATTDVGNIHMWDVSMIDASNGVAVGNSGQIVYTTNGGVDWTDAATTDVGVTYMKGVSMSDASNGVAVGNSGQIVYTTNGGVDWTDAATTDVGVTYMKGVSMSDASNGVAVGDLGQIVYTTNGGVDWTGSTQDVSELAKILGIPDEQLPPWVANLALWVSEDKISMGDMIVSIEHLINN